MGMDVYGKAPTAEVGEYFRRNVWGWRPLWDMCLDLFPELTEKVEYGHSNDGDITLSCGHLSVPLCCV